MYRYCWAIACWMDGVLSAVWLVAFLVYGLEWLHRSGGGSSVKYLVAVSGGIDSVALLDTLVREKKHELVVVHFDHGIRSDSAADARFVEGLAKKYHLPFVMKREELGEKASEEMARTRRYAFLREEAEKYSATIVTAHHADDVIETIAINLIRGTGWRGLAVLDSPDIVRPLLALTKQQLRDYANEYRLEWVEDSTNASTDYLRNRIRKATSRLPEMNKRKLLELYQQQKTLKRGIDAEILLFLAADKTYLRYFLIHVDPLCAYEILRAAIIEVAATGPTRPQLERALVAIKTAKPAAAFEIGGGVTLQFSARSVVVKTP